MRGKVYKIVCCLTDDVYIGSTTQELRYRFRDHKNGFKQYLQGKFREVAIFQYFKTYGIENFKILLIKEYDVSDKKQLLAYEQLWMSKIKCVNKYDAFIIPFLQKIKYNETNKKYRQVNRAKLNEKAKQKIKCDCGSEIRKSDMARHRNSKKHKEYQESQ